MGAAWYRADRELRRRWRATLLLVLLVGLAGGAVLATVAGARRSASAYERFRQETLASDLDVAPEAPPGGIEAAAAAVRALPQVAAVGRNDFPFIVPAGSGYYPYLDFLAAVSPDGTQWLDIDRPRIAAGRLPEQSDEIAISEIYAVESGLQVGDQAEFESFAPEQMEALFTTGDAGPPAGPRFTLTVTAIFDAPTFLSESSGDFMPRVVLAPAFAAEHGDEVATYAGGFTVRLHGGDDDVDAVAADVRKLFEGTLVEITPAAEVDQKINSSIDVIVAALALCALVAALAGIVAIGQALSRQLAAQGSNDRWLSALGMTRSERVSAHVATAVPIAVLGAGVAVVASILLSPLMPVGVAGRAEPDPGLAVDGVVVIAGFASIVVVVMALSVAAAGATVRRAGQAPDTAIASDPSRPMRALRRTSLAPPATIGVGMAVEPRGGTGWAVRSAILGVVFGAAGVIAVVVFVASLHALADAPDRYGAPFDALVSGFTGDVLAEGGAELLEDPDVAQAGLGLGGLARVAGDEVNTYALESLKGDMALTLVAGDEPRGGGEVALGETTLRSAGVELGDEVEIEGAAGSLRATVVGQAAFPVVDERSAPGRGVLLGREDFERISTPDEINADLLIVWADGVDSVAANAALAEATGTEVFAPRLPSDVINLEEVEALPRALAGFLAVLAVLAVVHALVSTVRMRRQDLAVLRTLGFVRRQLGSTLMWQATTIGVVGLVVGVPLGLVLGRVVWREVASGIGVVDDPATPSHAVAIVVIVALAIVMAAAVVPSRSARRVAAASALRSG